MATIKSEEIYGYQLVVGKMVHWECALKEFSARDIARNAIILQDDVDDSEVHFCELCEELML